MLKLPNSNKMRMSVVFAGLISINGIAGADAIVKIDGSSTVYPITEAVAEDFPAAPRRVEALGGPTTPHS